MTLTDRQREWIDGLRSLADFAERHPDVASAYSTLSVNVFAADAAEMADIARRFGGPFEKVSEGSFYNLRKFFGPHKVDVCASHDNVCERVQVGTESREVPDPDALAAVPTILVDEPVYQWVCPDSILAAAASPDREGVAA